MIPTNSAITHICFDHKKFYQIFSCLGCLEIIILKDINYMCIHIIKYISNTKKITHII